MRCRPLIPRPRGAFITHARQSKVIQGGIGKQAYRAQKPPNHQQFPELIPQTPRLAQTSFVPHPHEAETLALALRLLNTNIALGTRQYPHPFRNYGKLPLRHDGPYYEFPLLDHGKFFDGSQERQPGLKRIVFTREGELANIVAHDATVRHGFRRIA